jgi:hypothetical protein
MKTRRAFLKTAAGIFVPTTFAIGQGLTLRNPAYVSSFKAPAAGGGGDGPNTYYYGSAGATPASYVSFSGDWWLGDEIVCTVGGTITKIGVDVANSVATPYNLKFALYTNSSSWTLHEAGIVILTDSYDAFLDFTLVTGKTVANGETVLVGMTSQETGGNVRLNKGGDTQGWFSSSTGYANMGSTTPIEVAADFEAGVRVYVD